MFLRAGVDLVWFLTIIAAQLSIFSFDIFTQEDDVSIGFLYTLPTLMGFFVKERILLNIIVAISAILIMIGCFIPVPVHMDLLVFIANRILSVATVLITGIMIHYRLRLEKTLGDALSKERNASATQRAFVSMVSHEFRTPLTIIDAEAYRLVKLKDNIQPADIERRAKSIRSAVVRMITLIDSVLCSAQAQENRVNYSPELINLHDLIRTVCLDRSRDDTIAIDCIIGDLPEHIYADKNLLIYVFDNLVGNAIKYSPGSPLIKVIGSKDGDYAVITVLDFGIGIPAEDMPKLFEPYFRAANVSSFSGSGVGLYIVQTFVRLHGGRVEAKSVLGQGSTFTVRLPISGMN